MKIVDITVPLDNITLEKLEAGDQVYISGIIYTARDAAHKRLVDAIRRHEKLPFNLKDQVIYYTGPAPASPGQVTGSAGPTTSGRMDIYTPDLLKAGLKGMIGKGNRSHKVREAIVKNKAVYFAAIGGAGAIIIPTIKKSEVIAYPDLGAEAIHRLEVQSFPAIVINDIYGRDLYEEGKQKYRVSA